MRRKLFVILVCIVCVFSMSACGSGITQEQYDQLESEKKAVEDEKKKVDGELEQTKNWKPCRRNMMNIRNP